jgi:hypothetical protein
MRFQNSVCIFAKAEASITRYNFGRLLLVTDCSLEQRISSCPLDYLLALAFISEINQQPIPVDIYSLLEPYYFK